jgi:hypothetical protein
MLPPAHLKNRQHHALPRDAAVTACSHVQNLLSPGLSAPLRSPCRHPIILSAACLQVFTVKMSDGVVATSYSKGDKFFIDPQAS